MVVQGEEGRLLHTNPQAEALAAQDLSRWGFQGPGSKGVLVLKDKAAILRFHAFGLRRLDPDWKVETDFRFEHAAKQVVPIEAQFEFQGSGEDWFGGG